MTHEYIREKVIHYFSNNARYYISCYNELSIEDNEHIINIATSILLHKYNIIPFNPGGFEKAFLDNDLKQTFAQADSTNKDAIYFYVMLVNNIRL